MKEETVGQTLERLARESLPRHYEEDARDRNSERRCICGDYLPAFPKTRQKQLVCDACADSIPRLPSGRHSSSICAECRAVYPRAKLKMKNRQFYCRKCLKIKFGIDF